MWEVDVMTIRDRVLMQLSTGATPVAATPMLPPSQASPPASAAPVPVATALALVAALAAAVALRRR